MDLLHTISDWFMLWFGRRLRLSPENGEKRVLRKDHGSRETVIKDEIDAINEIHFEKIREKHENGEDLMPNCDVSVWLRDCKKEIIKPLLGEIQDEPKAKDIFSEAKIVAKVKTRWYAHPGYMHSFGMTDNYFIIVEQPMSIALPEMFFFNKVKNRPLSAALKFYKDHPTLIHLISRKTGKPICKFNAEPFFYLHIINQYEIEDYVILDICVYKDPSMIDCMFIEALKEAKHNPNYAKMFRSRPVRFILPLRQPKMQKNLVTLKETNAKAYWSKGKIYVVPEILCKIGCETPRINYPLHMGKKYRYFYAISSDVDLENPGTLIKVDTCTKKYRTWSEQGVFPSEPIFIPNLQSKDEDDGLILSSLLWTSNEKKVALLILDAITFEEIGRAVFRTPEPIPKCLHGWFIN